MTKRDAALEILSKEKRKIAKNMQQLNKLNNNSHNSIKVQNAGEVVNPDEAQMTAAETVYDSATGMPKRAFNSTSHQKKLN